MSFPLHQAIAREAWQRSRKEGEPDFNQLPIEKQMELCDFVKRDVPATRATNDFETAVGEARADLADIGTDSEIRARFGDLDPAQAFSLAAAIKKARAEKKAREHFPGGLPVLGLVDADGDPKGSPVPDVTVAPLETTGVVEIPISGDGEEHAPLTVTEVTPESATFESAPEEKN